MRVVVFCCSGQEAFEWSAWQGEFIRQWREEDCRQSGQKFRLHQRCWGQSKSRVSWRPQETQLSR